MVIVGDGNGDGNGYGDGNGNGYGDGDGNGYGPVSTSLQMRHQRQGTP